ncbi:SDR family oxidoreductase [Nocardioides sp. BP30]|uniref:SDR family oxidoreductase n=1 Tax=Nocardioides sp. BP30 TaxID=3036374 RepID=UPI0024691B51|nr:SDR family oxidoreductase [Nocardioides sp. BP30]WGL52037.1 SDR family oxidoreductase [Nocardioides sp. BP30]
MTSIENAIVLVTGANGGLGREFVRQALERGAAKVYATARTPQSWDDDRVVPLALDITDPASVSAAAADADDVTVLINNAGAASGASLLGDELEAARELFETNFWGQLRVTNAFAPVLANNGGGAQVNVLSVLSWLGIADAYSATKAALWSATNSQRLAFSGQGTQVLGLHLGYTDTPMTKDVTAEKNDPADVVRAAYDGLEAGAHEVLADDVSRQVKAGLAAPVEALYPQLAH